MRVSSYPHCGGGASRPAGALPFMPTTGAPGFDPQQNASPYEHASEVAQPGYYAVSLVKYGERVELASALRASMARITFPATAQANIVLDLGRSIGHANDGRVEQVGADRRTVAGWTRPRLGDQSYTVYFAIAFDRAFSSSSSSGPATAFTFDATKDQTLTMRVGISYVDAAGAAGNLAAEAPSKLGFDAMRAQARRDWNARLGRIDVSGGSPELTKTFYSNLYRFF